MGIYLKIKNVLGACNAPAVVFVFVVLIFAAIFLIDPQLGTGDDIAFLRTLQKGEFLFPFSKNFEHLDIWPMAEGRFVPMMVMEYNLVSLVSNTPFAYLLFNTLQFLIFIGILIALFKKFSDNKLLIYGGILLILFTPGFPVAWYAFEVTERNAIFFLAAFLLSYIKYADTQKLRYLILGIISANIAMYYKEPVFIAFGALAIVRIIAEWYNRYARSVTETDLNQSRWRNTATFDSLLIASFLAYLVFYFLFAHAIQRDDLMNNDIILYPFLAFARKIFNYIFSDPILLLVFLPFALWRCYAIVVKRAFITFADTMIGAGMAYTTVIFFIVGGYTVYYLHPVYVFAIPSLLYFLKKQILFRRKTTMCGIAIGFLLLFQTIPDTIHQLTQKKYMYTNFHNTIDFLENEIRLKSAQKPISLFLDKVSRGDGEYFAWAEYLLSKKLTPDQFDLKASFQNVPTPKIYQITSRPFSVFKSGTVFEIMPGDYLVVSWFKGGKINEEYLNSLQKNYQMIFKTKSALAFPNIGLKTLIKYAISFLPETYTRKFQTNLGLANKPDYYVFIKK